MNKLKVLNSITIPFAIATPLFCLISCNKKEPDQPDPPEPDVDACEQYISDRTFSLSAQSVIKKNDQYAFYAFAIGTAWIIDDATPLQSNDYWYYVATNWHVTHEFDSILQQQEAPEGWTFVGIQYGFADSSRTDRSDYVIENIAYVPFSVDPEYYFQQDYKNFIYSGTDCIDMEVCKVNFADDNIPEIAHPEIIAKLDKLNEFRIKNGYINKFVNADDESIIKKKKFIGGYPGVEIPSQEIVGSKWEFEEINPDQWFYTNKGETYPHPIGEDELTYPYIDVSPQYTSNVSHSSDWMGPGASGSMIITQDYEVCAIYWGGYADDANNFYPSASLFKTTEKDFISKWTN